MSEETEKAPPRLERLLRQWGAEEAADRAPVGQAPKAQPAPPARGRARWPWALVAGAVAAAAVAGLGLLWGQLDDARKEAQDLSRRHGELDARAASLQRQLDSARRVTSQTAEGLEARLASLVREANEALRAAAGMRNGLAAAEAERDQKIAELAKSVGEVAQWKKRLEDETAKVVQAAEDANAAGLRLASALGEMDRMRKMQDDALAAKKKAEGELDDLKARQAAVWNDFQQAYLAAAAPGETGLRAAQSAARRTQLLERCGRFRATADASHRPLLDTLEVVLTRLEMIETGPFFSEDLFRKLLASSGVLKALDAALESRSLPPPLRTAYFEARLILGGAERAG